jgi:hypothetical protein
MAPYAPGYKPIFGGVSRLANKMHSHAKATLGHDNTTTGMRIMGYFLLICFLVWMFALYLAGKNKAKGDTKVEHMFFATIAPWSYIFAHLVGSK